VDEQQPMRGLRGRHGSIVSKCKTESIAVEA
jgi:hypothetical protein